MCGPIGADRIEPLLDQIYDAALDLVAYLTYLFERAAMRICHVPVLGHARDVGAATGASESDGPIGMQLHLEVESLRLPPGKVDVDLVHRLDDLGPHRLSGVLPGRLGVNVLRRVPLEERLRHLGAPGVLGAD